MAVRNDLTLPTGPVARRASHEPGLPRLLERNEARLDRLQQRGVPVRVDGVAFLLAFFDRARVQPTRENRLDWGRFVERVLDDLETRPLAL
jgi:hypothetical protein